MHKPKVEFNKKFFNLNQMCNKELKNSPKEIRERERERIFTCLCEQNIDRIEERIANIYNKKKRGRRRVKIKEI